MAKTRKRRVRSPHPGVKLKRVRRAAGTAWLARWTDPDAGRELAQSLDALGLSTDEARRGWAISKSESLRQRAAAIASGAPLKSETPIADALASFYKLARLSESTVRAYREGTAPFETWCAQHGVRDLESLTAAKLAVYGAWFAALKAQTPARGKGVGQGAREQGKQPRSPNQINKGLRGLRTVLSALRRRGLLPLLNADDIRDSLQFVKGQRPLPRFLRQNEIRKLLLAAQRHDAETWTATRAEHAGEREPGTTPRYRPVFPFTVAALLTGCRFEELAGLRWDEVDLDAAEIRLDAGRTKTGHGRVIPLDVTPALAAMLASMKLRAGDAAFVFGSDAPAMRDKLDCSRHRLSCKYGGPVFTWHDLRRTCGTYLTNAPGLYGGASAWHSAKRLGHSVTVAEKHYAGLLHNIPASARTLEGAMQVEDLLTPGAAALAASSA